MKSGSGRCCCLRAEHQPEPLVERFGAHLEKAEVSYAARWVHVFSAMHGLALSKVQQGPRVSRAAQGTVAGGCNGTACLLAVGRR